MIKRMFCGFTIAVLSLSMNATPVVAIGEELADSADSSAVEQPFSEAGSSLNSESSSADDQNLSESHASNEEPVVTATDPGQSESHGENSQAPALSVNAHVAKRGWLGAKKVDLNDSELYFGTVGQNLQLEALNIKFDDTCAGSYIEAQAHVANIGWMSAVNAQQSLVGTTGQSKGIEALKLTLKGTLSDQYDLYYQVHCANFGWLGWAKNGEPAGSQGYARSIQAIRIAFVKKGETPSFNMGNAFKLSRPMDLSVTAHVAKKGWLSAVGANQVAGTTGQGLSMEALKVSVVNPPCGGAIELSAFANGSWSGYSKGVCGTTGKSLAIQAIKMRLTGELAAQCDIWYQAHSANFGWLDWAKNDSAAGSIGYNRAIQAIRIKLVPKGSAAPGATSSSMKTPKLVFSSHIANTGWVSGYSDSVSNIVTLGSVGKSRSLQAFSFYLDGVQSAELSYGVHVSNIGTMADVSMGQVAGTTGKGLPIESVHFKLSGQMAEKYDIWYRAHLSNIGWLGWARNGAEAGSQGISAPVEAVQVVLMPKGQAAPGAQDHALISRPTVGYSTFVVNHGWTQDSVNGAVSGTTGKSLPIKGIKVALQGAIDGGVSYSVHVSNKGWLNAVSNGTIAGSDNLANSVEAIRISLNGTASKFFDVWYRVHIDRLGWLGWAKNGNNAGSAGRGLSVQAVQVVLTRKGGKAPGSTSNSFVTSETYATATAMQRRVVDAARSTPSPGGGLCAQWVANVFSRCGFKDVHLDARDYYWRFCKSSDRNQLRIGMVIAVPSHAHTSAGSIWGHVCIYIGDGKIMDNVGRIRTMDLNSWLSYYSTNYTPKWGWYSNVPLA